MVFFLVGGLLGVYIVFKVLKIKCIILKVSISKLYRLNIDEGIKIKVGLIEY